MTSKRESNRLKQIEQAKVIDDATRKRRAKRHLDALEQDNFQDDPHANLVLHKKLPKFDDTPADSFGTKRKRKSKSESIKQRPRKTFGQLLEEEDLNRSQGANYLTAQASPSKHPQRHFCSVCGFHSNYTCIKCGARYCSMKCLAMHTDTRCQKWTM